MAEGETEKKENKGIKLSNLSKLLIASFAMLIVGLVVGAVALPLAGLSIVPAANGGTGGNAPEAGISQDALKTKLTAYLNENFLSKQGKEIQITGLKDAGSDFYEVSFNILKDGATQDGGTIYATKSGGHVVLDSQSVLDLSKPIEQPADSGNGNTDANLQKSDKPKVELFVFTYCPFGTQAEKATAPVEALLGAKADFKVVQIGAMHGAHEEAEAKRQLCIAKENPGKLWDYLVKFDTNSDIGVCGSNAACSAPLVDAIFAQLGIDKAKIDSCVAAEGTTLYNADVSYSQSLGVSGSPTFKINGTTVNVSRSPEAIKQVVCSAFNTAPSECDTALDTTAASAGFGGGTGTSTGASC